MKGCIALDIDGTLTRDPYHLPQRVVKALSFLAEKGWTFLFVTGRTFSFASSTLAPLTFPYFFAVQNGADLLHMPEKTLLSREYLPACSLPTLELVHEKSGFLLYAGWEKGDFCYYRPSSFSPRIREHLRLVASVSKEPWKELEHFVFDRNASFPLVKSLGEKEEIFALYQKLSLLPSMAVSYIKDPLGEEVYLNLITAKKATKGEALKKVKHLLQNPFCIAAGDDLNDVSLLEEADFSIAMSSGVKDLFLIADLIAPPVEEEGILHALSQATGESL